MTKDIFNAKAAANDNGPNPDREMLRAAEQGDLDKAKYWLKEGANVDARAVNADTPLILAARQGHDEVVKYLISRKAKPADVTLTNNEGQTALHVAARDAATPIALRLIEAGSPPDARDNDGATAIFYAAQTGNDTLIDKLAEASADIDLPDNRLTTPLMQAVKFVQTKAAAALLDRGATIDAQDVDGMSALMHAASVGNNLLTGALVASHAHIECRNKAGQTAIDIAHARDNPGLASLMERALKERYDAFHLGTGSSVTTMRPLTLKSPGETP